MLIKQQTIQFSEHSSLYDLIVPKENLLIKINDLIDFSFIYYELLNKCSTNNGRMAESLVRMFKNLLLKTISFFCATDNPRKEKKQSATKLSDRKTMQIDLLSGNHHYGLLMLGLSSQVRYYMCCTLVDKPGIQHLKQAAFW